jgi:hypothetical protein
MCCLRNAVRRKRRPKPKGRPTTPRLSFAAGEAEQEMVRWKGGKDGVMDKMKFDGFSIGNRDKTEAFSAETERLLLAIYNVSGINEAFVTDESCLSDFCLSEEDVVKIGTEIGIPVTALEDFGDIVLRMFQKCSKSN